MNDNRERVDIKEKMKELDISMVQLSRDTGIKYHTLNHYLNGYSPMPEETEDEINDYFKEIEALKTESESLEKEEA